MSIHKIIGNKQNMLNLKNQIENDKLSHCYIFEGEEGIGKKTIAMEFAGMIFCKENKKPCGTCSSCLKIKTQNHPDLFIKSPKKSEYTVDQAEEIQKEVRIKPNESYKKVFIITNGERMSIPFQNKFLKTLEEPPETCIIIILTDNINKLLRTTVSRCQKISIDKVSRKEEKDFLREKFGEMENLNFISLYSNGNIGKGIELVEDKEFIELRQSILNILDEIIVGDETKIISNIDMLVKNKENIEKVLDIIMTWIRDIILAKTTEMEKYIINRDRIDDIIKHGELMSNEKLYDIIYRIENTREDIRGNINLQLSMENLFYNIQKK